MIWPRCFKTCPDQISRHSVWQQHKPWSDQHCCPRNQIVIFLIHQKFSFQQNWRQERYCKVRGWRRETPPYAEPGKLTKSQISFLFCPTQNCFLLKIYFPLFFYLWKSFPVGWGHLHPPKLHLVAQKNVLWICVLTLTLKCHCYRKILFQLVWCLLLLMEITLDTDKTNRF